MKYCDAETIITALKSRSKLSRAALARIKNIQLNDNLDYPEIYQKLKLYSYNNDRIRLAKLIHRYGPILSWEWGLYHACQDGHQGLVNLMIIKGVTNYNWGLTGACQGGDQNLVNNMILNGATRCHHCDKSIEAHQT